MSRLAQGHAVVGFWIGSSYGGQKKDQTIADAAKVAAKSG